jgi:ribonuclease HII
MDIEKERARILKLYDRERKLKQEGFTLVAGIDEAGRGPWQDR